MIDLKVNPVFRFQLITILLFLLTTSELDSQELVKITKIPKEITFDGIPDEMVWENVQPFKMVMHTPTFGLNPTEESIVKIAFTDEFLFVSGIFFYKDPKNIRAIGKLKDKPSASSDLFGITIDSYNDKHNAFGLFINPNAQKTDMSAKNNLTIMAEDYSFNWNSFWDVKTVIKDSSWSAEFRIPFSSLRFQVKEGQTIMGIILWRTIAAKNEVSTYPAIKQSQNDIYPFIKPSNCVESVFEPINPRKQVYFAPYITAGVSQISNLNETGTSYRLKTTPKYDAGLDTKISVTNNLTMDLTLNTDFAQVEADDQKINLTRYSLFFPEKRIFFMEKSDVFDFSFLEGNNLFYSRRIGIYDGNQVRIYGGFRLTGRLNKWDLGIIDMQTATFEANPSENFGVIRTKRTILNPNSYIGGMITSRLGMNGKYNLGYGIDGQFNLIGEEYFTIKMAQTHQNDSLNSFIDIAPSKLFVQWERRCKSGFGYDLVYSYSGIRFNPGIGFEMKDNYQGFRTVLKYGWIPEKESKIRQHIISLTGLNYWNTKTGLQETFSGLLKWEYKAKKGYEGSIFITMHREDLSDTLTLGNKQAIVPPGRFKFTSLSATYNTSYRKDLSSTFTAEGGKFYDGWKISLSSVPNLKMGSGLDLGLTYYLDFLNFQQRMPKFTNHIIGFKGLLAFTTKTSLSAFVQYNTAIEKVMTNIRLRYNPREGNDFYIVYDEGLNTNIMREVPSLPYSAGRTILLKYTYTFIL